MTRTSVSIVAFSSLGALAFALPAHAKELTFSFDVFSSGPEIYPCDAGIWQGEQPKYCHFKGTATNCNPADVGKTPGQTGVTSGLSNVAGKAVANPDYFTDIHACICTGGSGSPNTGVSGGDYLMNFMRYKAAIWKGNAGSTDPNHRGWGDAKEFVAQGTAAGITVAKDVRTKQSITPDGANSVPQEFSTQLEAVTFNFGSELYGAHFFVDFCYRGPQIPYYVGSSAMNAKATFGTYAWLKSTNPFTGGNGSTNTSTLSYTELSKLKMKTVLACDYQGEGTYLFDHNGTSGAMGVFDTFDTDIKDTGDIGVASLAGNGVKVYPGSVNPNTDRFILTPPSAGANWVGNLTGDLTSLTNTITNLAVKTDAYNLIGSSGNLVYITNNSPKTPRFCKLRTYFVEESGMRERAWQRHDARFIVKWLLEENESTGGGEGGSRL